MRFKQQQREERRIRKILSRARRVSLGRKEEELFGLCTGDRHRIHSDKEAAREAGFKRCPIRGAHLAAIAYHISEEIRGTNTYPFCQKTSFRSPVYQRKTFNLHRLHGVPEWSLVRHENGETRLIANTKRATHHVESTIVCNGEVALYEDPARKVVGPIETRVLVSTHSIDTYHALMRLRSSRIEVPQGLVQAYVPGILVRILDEAYRNDSDQAPLPMNIMMETTSYEPCEQGVIDTHTWMISEKNRAGTWAYSFMTRVVQNNRVKSATTLRSISEHPIEIERLRRINSIEEYAF